MPYDLGHTRDLPVQVLGYSWGVADTAVGGANATGQDIIGVYFDEEATRTTYEPTPPDLGAPYWVAVKNMSIKALLLNTTSTSDFAGIHVRLTHNGEGAPYVTSLIGAQNPGMIDGIIMFGAQNSQVATLTPRFRRPT